MEEFLRFFWRASGKVSRAGGVVLVAVFGADSTEVGAAFLVVSCLASCCLRGGGGIDAAFLFSCLAASPKLILFSSLYAWIFLAWI